MFVAEFSGYGRCHNEARRCRPMAVRHEGPKIRLDPNNVQRGYLGGCAGAARVAYNFAVELPTAAQEEFTQARVRGVPVAERPRRLSAIDIQKRWHEQKDRRYPGHGQYPSKPYLFAVRQAVKAHRSWMSGTAGFPRVKTRSPQTSFSVCETLALRPRYLQLRRIAEASFGEQRRQVVYKCGSSRVLFCDRFYPSSKICSACGSKNDALTLRDRTWTCNVCARSRDRDVNAAINLAAWGEAHLGAIQAGDPDTPGPDSRVGSARPQRGTPHHGGDPRMPAWTGPRSSTAGTRQLTFAGAQDLDGSGQGPVDVQRHLHANRQ